MPSGAALVYAEAESGLECQVEGSRCPATQEGMLCPVAI